MYRAAIEQLKAWKERKNHKPLIIKGARQVGKTWLMKEFGSLMYEQTVYINFDNNQTNYLARQFTLMIPPHRILHPLGLIPFQSLTANILSS